MKDLFFKSLLIVSVLGWGMVFYQHYSFKEFRQQVSMQVVDELDKRKKIEDSIKHDIETRKKDQEFIAQQEYRSELETTVSSRLSVLEQRLAELGEELAAGVQTRFSFLESKLEGIAQTFNTYDKRLKDQGGLLDENKKETALKDLAMAGRMEKIESVTLQCRSEQKNALEELKKQFLEEKNAMRQELLSIVERISSIASEVTALKEMQNIQDQKYKLRLNALEESIAECHKKLAAPVVKQ